MTYRLVLRNLRHPCRVFAAISAKRYDGSVPWFMWRFFNERVRKGRWPRATHIVLAYKGSELAGCLVYSTSANTDFGTYVVYEHRGHGLGVRMWQRVLRIVPRKTIAIRAITRSGGAMVRALARSMQTKTIHEIRHYD